MSEDRDYYSILGVEHGSTVEAIRAAFRRIARARHPDRFSGEERGRAELEFQQITEAYNVLADPVSRDRYDAELDAAFPQNSMTNPKDLARALLARAITLLKMGDHAQAGELMRQAVAHDSSNAKAQHLWGMFLVERLGRLEQGLRHLDAAARLDSLNPRVLLDASRQFAVAKMFARAARLARSAADISPGDPAVELWLRKLQDMSEHGGAENLTETNGGDGS